MELRPAYFYRQSAVVPYRAANGSVEVLLITSRGGRRWTIPKGIVEPELSSAASAAKEAFEEAGVRGDVASRVLGSFTYEKWGGTCSVEVYALQVREELDAWPESYRQRRWFRLDDASDAVTIDALRPIFDALAAELGRSGSLES